MMLQSDQHFVKLVLPSGFSDSKKGEFRYSKDFQRKVSLTPKGGQVDSTFYNSILVGFTLQGNFCQVVALSAFLQVIFCTKRL